MVPRLIGMVHLGPLPGAPLHESLDAVLQRAVADAQTLEAAGFDAVMVENFGDVPFFADDVPKITIAAMTRAVADVVAATSVPIGVNVLRNDALGALAVAAATGAAFIRVNILSGVMYTDQGTITGRAAEVARSRRELAPGTLVLADVFVKHATPPPGAAIEQAAADIVERGLADALIVSGAGTAKEPDIADLRAVRDAAPGTPVLVGSGATSDNIDKLLDVAAGVIVGSSLKRGSVPDAIDADLAAAFVAAAR